MEKNLSTLFSVLSNIIYFALAGMVTFSLPGCDDPIQADKERENIAKAVAISYDQTNNFRDFEFTEPYSGEQGAEKGIKSSSMSFWATFTICELTNNGPNAQPFPYDVHNFYVEIGDKQFFYKDLEYGTYTLTSSNTSTPRAGEHNLAVAKFRTATQLGPEKFIFPVGAYPTVFYRFSIFIPNKTGAIDLEQQFKLCYKDYPCTFGSRNRVPKVDLSTKEEDLPMFCRSQATRNADQ